MLVRYITSCEYFFSDKKDRENDMPSDTFPLRASFPPSGSSIWCASALCICHIWLHRKRCRRACQDLMFFAPAPTPGSAPLQPSLLAQRQEEMKHDADDQEEMTNDADDQERRWQ